MDIKIYAGVQTDDTKQVATVVPLRATNINIKPNYSQTQSQALGVGGSFVSDGWVSRAEVSGDVDVELTLSQFKLFMEGMGFKFKKGTNPKNLELDQVSPKSVPLSLVQDLYVDEIHNIASSCYISTIKINAALQSYITANASVVGKDFETVQTKFNPTSKEGSKVDGELICLGATIKEDGTDITADIDSIDFTIDRKLEGKGALNSIYTKKVTPNGKGEVSLNLTFNEFNKQSYVKAQELLKKNTSYKVEIEFKDTKDDKRKIKITFPKVKVKNVDLTDLSGAGGLSKEMGVYTDEGKEIPFEVTIENYEA